MAAVLFEVEQAVSIAQHLPVVLVRLLQRQEIVLGAAATLGGCRLVQFHEVPRSVRADGSPRIDLFAFVLEDADELAQFRPGDVVELLPEGT